jgi:hypothetical protein
VKNLEGNDPSVDGLAIGTYADGSVIYAGQGDINSCYGQNPAASRIQLTGSNGAGAYSSCGFADGGELFDGSTAQYFVNHPDLKFYPTTQKSVSKFPGALKVGDKYFARVNLTGGSTGTYTQVSKVDDWGMYYVVIGEGEKDTNIPLEVLSCIHCDNGGVPPYCCTNGANNPDCISANQCGATLDLSSNDPSALGLLSGNYVDGVAIYPGTGDFADCGQDLGKN